MPDSKQPSAKKRIRLSGPLAVGLFFALLAIVLSLVGLGREHNLSLYNVALAIVLGGGVWGLISWAIATAVVQVEEDVATREHNLSEKRQNLTPRRQDRREEKD
jgi:hypothetical protein